MAAVTANGRHRPLLGRLLSAVAARRGRRSGRAVATLARAREHVVTVAALGAFDLGAFQIHVPHLGTAPGWIAVCLSLLALDLAVTGE